MTIQELNLKQCEEMYFILNKQNMPDENKLRMIKYVADHNTSLLFSLIHSFNYGRICGIRSERDVIKWNVKACFYNMKSYALCHDGNLPKDYSELMKWVHSREKLKKDTM